MPVSSQHRRPVADVRPAAPPTPPPIPTGSWRSSLWRARRVARAEAHKEGVVLVPLRVFVGLGWLRAAAEKAVDPAWWDGAGLTAFLDAQLAGGQVIFPAYRAAMEGVFLPAAPVLAWVVLIGQLLAGLGILFGAFTGAALLGGLFMNLNFLLAGASNPSGFYVVIQAALLAANAGAVLGLDARRAPSWPRPGLPRLTLGLGVLLALAVALLALSRVRAWDPAGSVHDPAMVLAILAGLAAWWLGLALLRIPAPPVPADRRGATAAEGGSGGTPTTPFRNKPTSPAATRARRPGERTLIAE